MPIFKYWRYPRLKELKSWARKSARRWYDRQLQGLIHYGAGFKGDPILHAIDEQLDINAYLAYADSRTEFHIDLLTKAASALKHDGPDNRLLMARALLFEVDNYRSRREYHDTGNPTPVTLSEVRNVPKFEYTELNDILFRNEDWESDS